MARKAYYKNLGVPASVVMIVTSICADYTRREKDIRSSSMNEAVKDKLKALNQIVDQALEAIEPGIREDILTDITIGRGYNKSRCNLVLCKDSYYARRRKLIHDIAVALDIINKDKMQ